MERLAPNSSQNRLKLPGASSMVTAKRASVFSPISVRSAICFKRSKFIFAPLTITAMFKSDTDFSATNFFIPAKANAPAGSAMARVSSKISFTAAQISSVLTVIISSTQVLAMRKGISPTCLTATPSANRPTESKIILSLAFNASVMQAASSGSTPITLVCGETCLTTEAIPAINPPPPTGTKIISRCLVCLNNSKAMVPCPAMTASSS